MEATEKPVPNFSNRHCSGEANVKNNANIRAARVQWLTAPCKHKDWNSDPNIQ